MQPASISMIVPMLNEAQQFPQLAHHLLSWQQRGCEVIVVDGGSSDDSVARARGAGLRVVSGPRGRARQMNRGAELASGDLLLFLHADTRLPPDALDILSSGQTPGERGWGRFDVGIDGDGLLLGCVARLMNWRSRLTGIATGDQAIFVCANVFRQVGGYPDQPLMEDVELSRRLKQLSPPLCLRARVSTSGRRWRQRGVWRTILLMWRLRLAYALGASAEALARRYQ